MTQWGGSGRAKTGAGRPGLDPRPTPLPSLNSTKEDEFNEHEFFGLLDDEWLNSDGKDLNHHFDFEINNYEIDDKLEFGENKFQAIV